MRTAFLQVVVIFATLLLVLTGCGHKTVTTTPIPDGFVHESGIQLLNGSDLPIKLNGVNLGGWLEWEGWIWGKGLDYIDETDMMSNLTSLVGSTQAQYFQTEVENTYITQADFSAIASDGFNVVRVPLNYSLLYSGANTYKASGWSILDNAIMEAKQAHVYVILDMHDAPCGQSRLFTANYTGGPTLWQSSECQDSTVAIWKAIAERYSQNNTVLGYDLLNEPATTDAQLIALYRRITAAIRQADNNHVIIYEGNGLATDFSIFTSRFDDNEMLSLHAYGWGSSINTKLAEYNQYADSLNSPLYVGEYGQAGYLALSQYVKAFSTDPKLAAYTIWTWKQVPELPTLQQIHETSAAQELIDWMNNTSRPKPTLAEAEQGMRDFIYSIQYQNTTTDNLTKAVLQ